MDFSTRDTWPTFYEISTNEYQFNEISIKEGFYFTVCQFLSHD